MSVCPKCGWNSPEGQGYCGSCGTELKGATRRPIVPPPPPDGQWSSMPPPPMEPSQPPSPPPAPPSAPGSQSPFGQAPGAPQNYFMPAILVTVLCCVPLGIPAIIYANQVNVKYAAGDVVGAQEASRKARMWITIAAVCGAIAVVGWVALMILGEMAK